MSNNVTSKRKHNDMAGISFVKAECWYPGAETPAVQGIDLEIDDASSCANGSPLPLVQRQHRSP